MTLRISLILFAGTSASLIGVAVAFAVLPGVGAGATHNGPLRLAAVSQDIEQWIDGVTAPPG